MRGEWLIPLGCKRGQAGCRDQPEQKYFHDTLSLAIDETFMSRVCALFLLLASSNGYTVSRPVLDSTLVLHASDRTAGAIDSLKFRGKEFVNAFDHGREWQSAVSYDGFGECLNPTEAGSFKDGAGPDSSSLLLDARTHDATLETTVRMAYWLAPEEPYKAACGEHKDVHAAQNKEVLSTDTLLKQVTVGYRDLPNVIDYLVTLNVGDAHQSSTVEAVTGYMPPEFSLFLTFDPATSKVAPLSDGPGEQPLPLILSTKDRQFAVGVYSPSPNPGYGRFLFLQNPGLKGWNTAKWNCVFRTLAIRPGPLSYRCFLAIGTVEEVRTALARLTKAGE